MNVTYTFDTRDKDLHNWKLTAVCDFDLADACFIANGSFSSGAFEERDTAFRCRYRSRRPPAGQTGGVRLRAGRRPVFLCPEEQPPVRGAV